MTSHACLVSITNARVYGAKIVLGRLVANDVVLSGFESLLRNRSYQFNSNFRFKLSDLLKKFELNLLSFQQRGMDTVEPLVSYNTLHSLFQTAGCMFCFAFT